MNFEQIDYEMQYNPPWYKDKKYFLELWNSREVKDHQLIALARLYARYGHMDKNTLILRALDTILMKFNLINKQSLFEKTQNLYINGYKIKKEKYTIF